MQQQKYWLGFSLIPDIGPIRLKKILDWFGDPVSAWNSNIQEYKQIGLSPQLIRQLAHHRSQINLDAELQKVNQANAWLLTLDDPQYPATIRHLTDAPPVLYVKGTLIPEDIRAIALVGTRNATKYGRDAAHTLSWQLAKQGITIVSGLAFGIDTSAHEGALAAGGRTLAILGCGIDKIYPKQNSYLAKAIIESGALISEFPIGTPPRATNFPPRNRLISGFALGVVVVEAPERSGALITAETALEQGREVFAVPANMFNPMGAGTNRLIQDGAKLVATTKDILDELNIAHSKVQTIENVPKAEPSDPLEKILLSHLGTDPTHIDEIARMSGLSINVVSSTLTILDLKGLAQMVGHMHYCLTYESQSN